MLHTNLGFLMEELDRINRVKNIENADNVDMEQPFEPQGIEVDLAYEKNDDQYIIIIINIVINDHN